MKNKEQPASANPSYELVTDISGALRGIKCLYCHRVSYSQEDVRYLYCSGCDVSHHETDRSKDFFYDELKNPPKWEGFIAHLKKLSI